MLNPAADLGLFCVESDVLSVLVWVLSGYCGFLQQSKDLQVRLIGDSKLALGVKVSMNGSG